jgi:hypothetical protein
MRRRQSVVAARGGRELAVASAKILARPR